MSSPFWRLYLNLDEGAEVRTPARSYPLRAGHLYVVPAWLSWRAWCAGTVRHGNALLDLPSLGRERARTGVPQPLLLAGPRDPLALGWIELFKELSSMAHATVELTARGHALAWDALACMFARAPGLGPLPLTPRGDAAFQRLLYWAETSLEQPLGRRELAAFAAVSEAELARRFREYLGVSPARWVRERRISYAARLLRQTRDPIERIAERAGLGDRAQFSKVFARWCGCGPATWRRLQ